MLHNVSRCFSYFPILAWRRNFMLITFCTIFFQGPKYSIKIAKKVSNVATSQTSKCNTALVSAVTIRSSRPAVPSAATGVKCKEIVNVLSVNLKIKFAAISVYSAVTLFSYHIKFFPWFWLNSLTFIVYLLFYLPLLLFHVRDVIADNQKLEKNKPKVHEENHSNENDVFFDAAEELEVVSRSSGVFDNAHARDETFIVEERDPGD